MQIGRWLMLAAVGAVSGALAVAAVAWADDGSGDFALLVFVVPTLAACSGLALRQSARSAVVAGLSGAIAGGVVLVPLAREWNGNVDEPIFAPEFIAAVSMAVAVFPLALFCLGVWAWRLGRRPE